MKFCSHCGAQIDDDAVVCVKCGCQVSAKNVPVDDRPSTGFMILSFFIPLVGLILYLIWHTDSPLKAKSCGKGALIGVGVSVVAKLIYSLIVGALLGSSLGSFLGGLAF